MGDRRAGVRGVGGSPILDPILSNPRLRACTTVVKGLFNHSGGAGNGHDQGFSGLWTGMRSIGTFSDPWGAGPSIDQQIAKRVQLDVPFPTVNCGVLSSSTPLTKDHRKSFAYLGERQPIPTETDPTRLFGRLFAPGETAAVAQRRIAQESSVLDFGAKELARLRGGLGRDERDKLDVHASAIRDYERRASLIASRPRTGRCTAPSAPAAGLDLGNELNVPVLVPAMLDLVALAIACDLVRVVTMPIGLAATTWRYDWLGIGTNSHDDIAHKDDGKNDVVTGQLVQIGRWHAEQVARLALMLDALPSSNGRTVLDDTLIVWSNELATGQHGLDDIPVTLVGGAAGRLKAAGGLVDAGPQTYHRLGCTVLELMGAPSPARGEPPCNAGLLSKGRGQLPASVAIAPITDSDL
ncbi:MAG: hypothetical protein NVS3B10_06510 [Polyangiales bacterium]